MRHRSAQYLADPDLLRTLLRHIGRQSEKAQTGDQYRQHCKYRSEPAYQQLGMEQGRILIIRKLIDIRYPRIKFLEDRFQLRKGHLRIHIWRQTVSQGKGPVRLKNEHRRLDGRKG